MKQKFERRLQQTRTNEGAVSNTIMIPGFIKVVRQEFAYYESEKVKRKYLSTHHDAQATIRPTSVDSERAFSVSGNFATKIRSRLADDTLNMLCVLKSCFVDEKNA